MGGGGGSKHQGGDKAQNMTDMEGMEMQSLPPAPAMPTPAPTAEQALSTPALNPAAGLTRPESIAQALAFPNIEVNDPAPVKPLAPHLEYDPALQQMKYFDGQMGYRYEERNKVVGNHTPIELGYEADHAYPKSFGQDKRYGPGKDTYIETNHPNGKDIHGGGSGCDDPFAPRQGWRPTHGCIRMQNEDIQDLSGSMKANSSNGFFNHF